MHPKSEHLVYKTSIDKSERRNAIIVGDFSALFQTIGKTHRESINSRLEQQYRQCGPNRHIQNFSPKADECTFLIIYSPNIPQTGQKTSLKFKKMESITSIFCFILIFFHMLCDLLPLRLHAIFPCLSCCSCGTWPGKKATQTLSSY